MADARRSYDRIARSYKEHFDHELEDKPFDREFLDRYSSGIPDGSLVVDLGCGPGQIGRHVSGARSRMLGIDLSLEMLRQARAEPGGGGFVQADMRRLPLRDGCVQGLLAFYSLIHIPPDELGGTVAEIARVVSAGGSAAVAVHATFPPERAETTEPIPGGGLRVAEMLSQPVELDFFFHDLGRMTSLLQEAGFEIVWGQERDPYPAPVEVQTRRAYVLARKPE